MFQAAQQDKSPSSAEAMSGRAALAFDHGFWID